MLASKGFSEKRAVSGHRKWPVMCGACAQLGKSLQVLDAGKSRQ